MDVCELCKGTLHVRNSKGFFEDCECLKKKRVESAFDESKFPSIYRTASFSNFSLSHEDSQKSKQIAEAIASDYYKGNPLKRNVFIHDPNQIYGKLLACLIAKAAIRSGFKVVFANVQQIFDESMDEEKAGQLKRFVDCDLLVVEFMKDFMNKKIPSLLTHIIYERYSRNSPIIFNSLFAKAQLVTVYDSAVYDALLSVGVVECKVVKC